MAASPGIADALASRETIIAEQLTARHFERYPQLERRYGAAGREKCLEDARFHLTYLAQAVRVGRSEVFREYVEWASSMLESRGIPAHDLADHLRTLLDVIREVLPDAANEVDAIAMPALSHVAPAPPEALDDASQAAQFLAALRRGGAGAASAFVFGLLDAGTPLQDIYVGVFEASQHEVGRLWQTNQISVAEEHYYTAATQVVISQLYPRLFATPARGPAVVVACVAGEQHEIGPRMVADLLQLEGFDTHFVGANVPTRDLVKFVQAKGAAVVGLSATITPHLAALEAAIRAIRDNPATRHVKVIVGGYPFKRVPGLWRSVGADAFAPNAREAIQLVKEIASS